MVVVKQVFKKNLKHIFILCRKTFVNYTFSHASHLFMLLSQSYVTLMMKLLRCCTHYD